MYFLHRKRPPEVRLPTWTPGAPGLAIDQWPTHSSGCANRELPVGFQARTVRVGDRDRQFDLQVPRNHAPDKPLPLIMFFHGKGPPQLRNPMRGPSELGVAAGDLAIIAVPKGLPLDAEGNVGWNLRCDGFDMPFFDALLADVESSQCINPRQVFAAGHSNGADMVDALACCRGDRLRAIAPASGGNMSSNERCPARRLPAFRLTYGGRDTYHPLVLEGSVRFFRTAHGCAEPSVPADAADAGPCLTWKGCGQPVISCRYAEMGHTLHPDFGADTWGFFAGFL